MGLENRQLGETPETPREKISGDTNREKAELLKDVANPATGAYIDEDGKLRFTGGKETNEKIGDTMLTIRTQEDFNNLMKILNERGLTWKDLQNYPPNKGLPNIEDIRISNGNGNYKGPKSGVDPIIWIP